MGNSRETTRAWTIAEEERLRLMLDAGKTAAEIAAELDRTRHAVYGRVQRLYRSRNDAVRSDRDGPTWG
jgi:DNA-binding CsgD family transcriptional regulator